VDDRENEDLLRPLVPLVLGALLRRYGHLDLAEGAVQEALLARSTTGSGTQHSVSAWAARNG
jgi:predicted RNA polymerase sigma factor